MKKKRTVFFLLLVILCALSFSTVCSAGWKQSGGKTKYYDTKKKTYVKNGWKKISGKWYYFDKKGYLKTGRFSVGGKYYYVKRSTGRVVSKKVGSYYYAKDGVMVKNRWVKIKKQYFYFGSNGKMKTGKFTVRGKTYYCKKDTGRVTSKRVGDYYYNSKGEMVKNRWVKNYYYGSNGKSKYGMFTVKGKTYCCLKGSGKVVSQWYEKHYYDKDGVMATSQWIGSGSNKSYVDAEGNITKGNKNPKNPPKEADVRLLASITFAEAGNQSYKGMLAVASVIVNRVNSSKFPNTLKSVIFQSGQFSAVYSGYFNRAYYSGSLSSWEKKAYANCKKAATEVLTDGSKLKGYYFFNTGYGRLKIGSHWFS